MTPTTLIATIAKSGAAALAALVMAGALSSQASAFSMGVKMACASDYYSYCSQHSLEGPGVRQCMRAHGLKLSNRCVNALVASGEVSKAEVDRRRAMAAKSAASKSASAK